LGVGEALMAARPHGLTQRRWVTVRRLGRRVRRGWRWRARDSDDGTAGCPGEAQEGLQKGLRREPLVTRIEIVSRHRATGRATARMYHEYPETGRLTVNLSESRNLPESRT
jgi:hypothetical protein